MSARTLRRIGVVKSRVKERPQRPPPQDEASHAMYHHSPPPSMSSSPPHFGGSQDAAMSTPRTSKPKVFGIGVLLRYQEGNYFIEKMVEGGPAQRSGELNIGDCLVEVDGQICCNKTLNEVLEMIRGREGSTVKLTLFNNKRTDGQMYETVEIIRGDIPRKNAQKSAIIHVQPLVQVDSPHIQAALQQASVLGTPRGERMPITSQSASTPRLHYDPSSVGMLPPRGNQTPRGGSQTHRGERPSSPYGSAPSYEPQSAPATPRGGESAHGEYTSPSGFSTPGMGRSSSGPTYVDGAVLLGTQNVVTMQGWMFKSKHSGIFSSFSIKHRWFVLRNSLLSYYRSDDDPHPINTLNMRQCKGMKTVGKVKGHFGLQLRFPWKDYFVWAPSNNERSRWAAAFKASRGE